MEPERARELCHYLQTTLQLPNAFCDIVQDDLKFNVELYAKLMRHLEPLEQALQKAYPDKEELKIMIERELEVSFSSIPYYAPSYSSEIYKIISWADSQGCLLELIAAAHKRNPRNIELRTFFAQTLKPLIEANIPSSYLQSSITSDTNQALLPDKEVMPNTHNGSKEEAIIQPGKAFTRVGPEFSRIQPYICRVEVPALKAEGTGFLIGNSIVITNYHVMRAVFRRDISWDRVAFRFDYSEDQADTGLQRGIEYMLADTWQIVSSPAEKLDYVLVRLNPTSISTPTFGRGDLRRRGCLKPEAHKFRKNEALWIIQHPSGAPLRSAIPGTISRIEQTPQRIYYTTNTLPGSSGSPCLNDKYAVVALHRTGSPLENEGVPFSAILADIRAQGFASVICQ